jgi:DNA polymerase elongation subunit (family B)
LSSDDRTAIAEVRPRDYTPISVGKFQIVRDQNVLAATESLNRKTKPKNKKLQKSDMEHIWESINEAFSEPMTYYEDTLQYTSTQYLAEAFKNAGFDGVKYKLGIGGIHSDDKPGIFTSTDTELIIDCDIASMYPTLIVNNNLYPSHLSRLFLDLYKKIILQRLEAKKLGNETESYVLKILLNSVFGKTLFEHHWLYDPLVGLRVTINGQLYMLMLIEGLSLTGIKVLSANTDGIVSLVNKERLLDYELLCKEWENYTKFKLEYTGYKKYIRKDVNNYITIKGDNSIKEKGEFLQFEELSLRQGIDKPIISKALYNLFVKDIPIEDTIYNEKSIYSFCIAKKTDDKFINEFHTLENNLHKIEELQKTVRFYISTNGGTLYKVDKINNKYISYCVNRKVTILNNNQDNKDIKDYNIDYGYYIKETKKIIDEIINPQLILF